MKALSVVLVLALAALAMAGYHGHGHGNGYGHAGHHGGYGHGHGGWGWRQYHGWANVQSHQTPYSYNYGLQESGKGYNKWVYQSADAHHATPVHYGHGHGHGYHG